jgi:hypothetical protein
LPHNMALYASIALTIGRSAVYPNETARRSASPANAFQTDPCLITGQRRPKTPRSN